MWSYLWPILLIVTANVIYNITTKSTPAAASPFLALTVTYLSGAVLSFAIYIFAVPERRLVTDLLALNWTSYALAASIVGLEVGYIYLYRAGWKLNAGSLTANILLALALIAVGALFYRETLTLRQAAGVILCIGGLALLNL